MHLPKGSQDFKYKLKGKLSEFRSRDRNKMVVPAGTVLNTPLRALHSINKLVYAEPGASSPIPFGTSMEEGGPSAVSNIQILTLYTYFTHTIQ